MKQTKQVLGLPVMGMKEGKTRGIAVDFMLDAQAKKVCYIILKTEIGYGFNVLKVDDVKGIGANYIMIESVDNAKKLYGDAEVLKLMESVLFGSDLLGAQVLSVSGNVLPNVNEFTFDEKTGKIETLILDNGKEHSADSIATLSHDVVFLDIDDIDEEEYIQEPVQEEPEAPEAAPVELSEYAKAQREYLLGHVVTFDIVDAQGNVIIPKDTIVTDEVIAYAESMDVSADLALNVD